MKILLFNDNPVVQKLVALSAQKTKDELTVASSAEEIQEGSYDLLIVDDALYSDETFAAIKEYVVFKSALLMATRGNAVPAGFENVINKPFLPTDLVDTLIQIEKHCITPLRETPSSVAADKSSDEESLYSIDLEETLMDFEPGEEEDFVEHEAPVAKSAFDLDTMESLEEGIPKTAILDQEEVQEVRELLEDADSDMLMEEEEGSFNEIADSDIPGEEEKIEEEKIDEEEYDFDSLIEEEEAVPQSPETIVPESFDFDEGMADDEVQASHQQSDVTDPYDFDTLAEAEVEPLSIEEIVKDESDEELLLDEEEFSDLELKIQEAVEELDPEDLEMELGEEMFESFMPAEDDGKDELFDELDLLDERELKLAVGEEIEDEPDVYVGESAKTSMAAEALGEVTGKPVQWNKEDEKSSAEVNATTVAEGAEALQALLKALANEDVAKSLKGLNISININFGNNA